MKKKLNPCPFCNGVATIEVNRTVFHRQNYSGRYPAEVATQTHGFQVRCGKCGCQTCWWHYESEAIESWNTRSNNDTGP